jgi:cytochrome c peroxidase
LSAAVNRRAESQLARITRTICSLLLAAALSSPCLAQSRLETAPSIDAAQSALNPQFTPPAPGTYSLPPIDTITDHRLVDSTGKPVDLFALTAGKITVISFMYTSCHDVGGCPLAAAVLQQIDQLLDKRPELAKQVTLISMSFDIERDTSSRLAEIRAGIAPRTAWHFLTSANQENLQTVLADFNQPVAKLWNEDGSWSGLFRHVLKVYLLDARHQVRNIYSTGLFSAQLVLNDIETVLMETDEHAVVDGQQ